MSTFDPYRKWLGIPEAEQPPHHYRLLGIPAFEADLDVIEAAADRQMTYIRGCSTGPNMKESQQLLNELSAARVCLLNPAKKQAYDSELKVHIAAAPAPASLPASSPVVAAKETAGAPKKFDTTTPADVAHQERRARKLLDEQDFDAAIPLLVKLAELKVTLYKTSSDWAAAELPKAKHRQEKLRERVRAACEKANALLKTYNYAEATQLLDALPAAARSEEARRLLEQAGQSFEDCLGLQQEIDDAVKSKRYERLLPLVKRFLKLKPDSIRMQNLARNLDRNSPERAIRNYKGTGKYFDVAGRLVEVKELVVGLGLIAALVFGATYGVKNYGHHIRTLADSASPKSSPGVQVPPAGEERTPQSETSVPKRVPEPVPPAVTTVVPAVVPTDQLTAVGVADASIDEIRTAVRQLIEAGGQAVVTTATGNVSCTRPEHVPLGEFTVRSIELLDPLDDATFARMAPKLMTRQVIQACVQFNAYSKNITSASLDLVGKLVNLQLLILSNSGVSDDGFEHLSQLAQLNSVFAENTPMTGIGFRHLTGLPDLKRVALDNSQLNAAGMKHVCALPHLENANLFGPNLTDEGLVYLAELTSLKGLYLGPSPQVTQKGAVSALRRLKTVEQLRFEGAQYDDGVFDGMTGMDRMTSLILMMPKLTGKGVGKLASVKNLATFQLIQCDINDDGLAQFAQLPALTSLQIHQNGKPLGRGLRKFKSASSLKSLSLDQTRVNSGDLKAFQAALPKCQVTVTNPP